ncbi:MAG: hypothetical protein ACI91T_002016 [Natronomonas sp.]|jgi:hypothetical protein
MRPTFGREYMEDEFRRIADCLSDPLTVSLIGGGAMALRDLKDATKDIDLVVPDSEGYGRLWDVLMELGYAEIQSLGPDYRALGTTSCVENNDGCRLDLFNRQVANELVLTDGMRERSEPFRTPDPLTLRLVSNEDVFLLKLVAGRDDDLEDANVLVQTGLDFDVVAAELDAQIDRLGDDRFVTYANETLYDLEDEYGVTTPIHDRIDALTVQFYQGLESLQVLDEPKTVGELAEVLDIDPETVRERVTYLEQFGRVSHTGEEVRPARR